MQALSLFTFAAFLLAHQSLTSATHIDNGGLVVERTVNIVPNPDLYSQSNDTSTRTTTYIVYGVPNRTLIAILLSIGLITIIVPLCMICCILRKRRDRWEGERAHLIYKALEAEGSYDDRSSFETLGPETPTQTAILEIARRDIEERPPVVGVGRMVKAINRTRSETVTTLPAAGPLPNA